MKNCRLLDEQNVTADGATGNPMNFRLFLKGMHPVQCAVFLTGVMFISVWAVVYVRVSLHCR